MEEKKVLSRDEILAAVDARALETAEVDVPEWGGTVLVRLMNANDVERTGLADGERDASMFPKVIAACVVDEEGNPMFSPDDVAALARVDMMVAARVFAEIMRVNGLADEELEEAVQSFAAARPGASSTA